MKKRDLFIILFIGILFFLILANFVSAACPNNQRIMKLSSETNAHGEIWDGTNYDVEICYNEIFGEEYKGKNPHACSATINNKIVSLSSNTNAHAQSPEIPSFFPSAGEGGETPSIPYAVDVCYGDLSCRSTIENCNSSEGESLIVSLSSDTNAHLSISDYDVKICCKTGARTIVTGAYWANMINEPIDKADLNDRVKLIVIGEGFEGKEINFTIYKDVWYWFDKKVASSSSFAYTTWVANQTGTYYFKAIASDGLTDEFRSGDLDVSSTEDNSPPIANILTPITGEIYFKNELINFTQASYDDDSYFNYTWNFGDGNLTKGNSITFENYNTTHSYNSSEQKNILLDVEDEKGLNDRDRTSILVIDPEVSEKIVFAHIFYPAWGDNIVGNIVQFNATTSYAIFNNATTGNITCIAGLCPNETHDRTYVSGTPNWTGFENLEFNWTFIEASGIISQFNARGRNGGMYLKEFSRPATSENPHRAILIVSINPSSTTETEFSMNFISPVCIGGWIEPDNSFWPWDGSNYNCYRANGIDIQGNPLTECCPQTASVCIRGNGCISGPEHCSNFTEQSSCEDNSGHPNIAIPDINMTLENDNKYCGYDEQYPDGSLCKEKITNCRCSWNGTNCINSWSDLVCKETTCYNVLNLPANISNICNASLPRRRGPGECNLDISYIDNCNTTGESLVRWNFINWTGTEETRPEYCRSGEREVDCVEVLLSFMSVISLIIALVIIIVFYLIVIKRKKKFARKRKR